MKFLLAIPLLLTARFIGAIETTQTLSRSCNEVINIIPTQVTLAYLTAAVDAYVNNTEVSNGLKFLIESNVKYDVRARKICTSCKEANEIWETTSGRKAGKVMKYCKKGTFQYGRTMSGLVMEPIDPATGELVEGKVAVSFANRCWLHLVMHQSSIFAFQNKIVLLLKHISQKFCNQNSTT